MWASAAGEGPAVRHGAQRLRWLSNAWFLLLRRKGLSDEKSASEQPCCLYIDKYKYIYNTITPQICSFSQQHEIVNNLTVGSQGNSPLKW
jgi:hypothetical protein